MFQLRLCMAGQDVCLTEYNIPLSDRSDIGLETNAT